MVIFGGGGINRGNFVSAAEGAFSGGGGGGNSLRVEDLFPHITVGLVLRISILPRSLNSHNICHF